MLTRHIKLIHPGIPDPERRFSLINRDNRLSAENRPPVMPRISIPSPAAGFKKRIPMLYGFRRQPQVKRSSGRPAGMIVKHSFSPVIIGNEGRRMGT
jgi:hypothetical protein